MAQAFSPFPPVNIPRKVGLGEWTNPFTNCFAVIGLQGFHFKITYVAVIHHMFRVLGSITSRSSHVQGTWFYY